MRGHFKFFSSEVVLGMETVALLGQRVTLSSGRRTKLSDNSSRSFSAEMQLNSEFSQPTATPPTRSVVIQSNHQPVRL